MKPPQIMPSRSILPNSSPEILRPMLGCGGVFQVIWVEALDVHALLYERNGAKHGAVTLACHNNGHSCRALAERMISGPVERALEQAEFIRDCGGMAASQRHIESITGQS